MGRYQGGEVLVWGGTKQQENLGPPRFLSTLGFSASTDRLSSSRPTRLCHPCSTKGRALKLLRALLRREEERRGSWEAREQEWGEPGPQQVHDRADM